MFRWNEKWEVTAKRPDGAATQSRIVAVNTGRASTFLGRETCAILREQRRFGPGAASAY